LPIFIKYKALNLKLKANPVSEEEEERLYNELHDWGSEIVVNKVRELKGFYVKAGQIISTRVDIFPEQLMFGGFKNL
jgi:predicted unusual protein kinase regulating ubiquinone biosynthesis (AarF/ABC1/UbiB family)